MSVGSDWCLRGLGVLHPKPLEKILSVLCLGEEGAILEFTTGNWLKNVGTVELNIKNVGF